MSDFSLTLVLQIKTSKIINDMAKVQQKSEKITAIGGIFFVLDKFDSILSSVIDSHIGLRSTLIGYQYSEIIRAIFSVFCCGGDCMEDLNLYLKDVLTERPHTRVPSADTVLRGIEELATENISYTAEKTGNVYDLPTRSLWLCCKKETFCVVFGLHLTKSLGISVFKGFQRVRYALNTSLTPHSTPHLHALISRTIK